LYIMSMMYAVDRIGLDVIMKYGRGVGGKEWGKLGRYHRGSGVAINLTLFLCAYYIVFLAPHICNAQTKHRHVSPWCGDGVGVLGLGAA
jgi:hypothetical protein